MKPPDIHDYLAGKDRRSIGRVNKLVKVMERQPELLPQLVREMWNANPVVAMRAADAVEKLTRGQGGALQRFKKELLGLAEEASKQELRWHLGAMLPRLNLSTAERRRTVNILMRYLEDRSSIVRTFALQALFDLSLCDAALQPQMEELLTTALHTGTAAMRARARKLLARLRQT
ncbi:MAG TPA: hypothetical protein VH196_00790 [Terriglobales bacterium]|jgi:hypothetical protein|nr:hypothetical protein [Terriglobales bacterium]